MGIALQFPPFHIHTSPRRSDRVPHSHAMAHRITRTDEPSSNECTSRYPDWFPRILSLSCVSTLERGWPNDGNKTILALSRAGRTNYAGFLRAEAKLTCGRGEFGWRNTRGMLQTHQQKWRESISFDYVAMLDEIQRTT